MKTAFIKFLPIIAAVMLATSCSKDDNDNAPATSKDDVHTVATNTIPFSIRVNTGHSLKKVGYAESTNEGEKGWYNITFSDNDVANQLKMIIKEGNTPIGEATLQSDKATFSGSLTQQPSSNASLTAEISVSGSKNSSDKSLADLLATCAHNFIGEFKFGDKTVDLTDQNAYLAISMSPCCEHEIKINTTDYTVKDGRIWIAIPSDADVTSTGLGKEISKSATEVSPGTIYTVARQCFTVADGKKVYFSPGNLQATYNGTEWAWGFAPSQTTIIGKAAANTSINGDGTVSTNGTVDLFGWVGESSTWTGAAMYGISNSTTPNSTNTYGTGKNEALKSDWGKVFGEDSPWYTLSHKEWVYLLGKGSDPSRSGASDLRHWASVNSVNGLIILPDDYDTEGLIWSSIDWATLESAGAVFLPAAGYRFGTDVYAVGDYGDYWSSSARDEDDACDLFFGSDYVGPDDANSRGLGLSVRLVRAL
ncbi:MAG: hypothetical protein J6T70_12415 [Bacteroidales bacterium]|nr:hypothetical protein [Bacteroidales bacterium]